MSTPHHATPGSEAGYRDAAGSTATSPWATGLALFAGTLMIIGGVFQALSGWRGYSATRSTSSASNYVYSFDVTTWGWIHLIIGILVAVAGAAVLSGQLWGRVIGIGVVTISMFANFLSLPYYPLWSLLIIALEVFVIWALCSYDRDAAAAR